MKVYPQTPTHLRKNQVLGIRLTHGTLQVLRAAADEAKVRVDALLGTIIEDWLRRRADGSEHETEKAQRDHRAKRARIERRPKKEWIQPVRPRLPPMPPRGMFE